MKLWTFVADLGFSEFSEFYITSFLVIWTGICSGRDVCWKDGKIGGSDSVGSVCTAILLIAVPAFFKLAVICDSRTHSLHRVLQFSSTYF